MVPLVKHQIDFLSVRVPGFSGGVSTLTNVYDRRVSLFLLGLTFFPEIGRGGVLVEVYLVSGVTFPSSRVFGLPLRFWFGPHRSIALDEKRTTVPLFKHQIDFLSS